MITFDESASSDNSKGRREAYKLSNLMLIAVVGRLSSLLHPLISSKRRWLPNIPGGRRETKLSLSLNVAKQLNLDNCAGMTVIRFEPRSRSRKPRQKLLFSQNFKGITSILLWDNMSSFKQLNFVISAEIAVIALPPKSKITRERSLNILASILLRLIDVALSSVNE